MYLLWIHPSFLVGGWTNLFEKYDRQIGSFPQAGVKIKDIWNHQLDFLNVLFLFFCWVDVKATNSTVFFSRKKILQRIVTETTDAKSSRIKLCFFYVANPINSCFWFP